MFLANSAYYHAGSQADMTGSYVNFDSMKYDTGNPDLDVYYNLGFKKVVHYDISSANQYELDDVTSIYLAYKPVLTESGEIVNCYACAVRGTNGTLKE